MTTREISVRRFSVVSTRSFDETLSRLTATIGRPDMHAFHRALVDAPTAAALEALVRQAVGSSNLMEFIRFDVGAVLRKEGGAANALRLLIGNPIIMKAMALAVPDAAAYAPVTILVDERADGVYLSYDSMASSIAPYGAASALAVAVELDTKVEQLLEHAAR